jgi:hypothetical protein
MTKLIDAFAIYVNAPKNSGQAVAQLFEALGHKP